MFAIHKSPDERREDRDQKQARFGGRWRPPDYIDQYFDATRVLYAHALNHDLLDELALPLVYLQRHTVELVIKDLLTALFELSDGQQTLADAQRGPAPEWKPTQQARNRLVSEHDLGLLVDDLRKALAGLGHGSVPQLLIDVCGELSKVEAGEASRLRYSTFGARQGPRHRSFPKQVVLPVGGLQALLEALMAEIFATSESDSPSSASLTEDLYYEAQAQAEALYELGLL